MIGDTKDKLKKIKKLYGEEFSHFCKSELSVVLDSSDILLSILKENFAPNKSLLEDLQKQNKVEDFVNFIMFKYRELNPEKEKEVYSNFSPEELLRQNGYTLTKIETIEQFESFKKYYSFGEVPCSFNQMFERLYENNVFFAVKDNAEGLDRFSFTCPTREDEYSLSVLLIQFTNPKKENEVPAIKYVISRYNHMVENPNSTLGLDLNLLVSGLASAFENYYGYSCTPNAKKDFVLKDYVKVGNMFYKTNITIDNMHYCPNNVVISGNKVRTLDREKYILADYLLVDMEHKQVKFLDNGIEDPICKRFENIVSISISKNKRNGYKKLFFKFEDSDDVELLLDKNNSLIGYTDNSYGKVEDGFFIYAKNLEYLYLPNYEQIGNQCFSNTTRLEVLDIPNVVKIGNFSFMKTNMKMFTSNRLKYVGECSFIEDKSMEILNLPNLIYVGEFSFKMYSALKLADIFNVKTLGKYCFSSVEDLKEIKLDNLVNMGEKCFDYAPSLAGFVAPNLLKVPGNCLNNVGSMQYCVIPKVESIGDNSFYFVRNLKNFKADNLKSVGQSCFEHSYNLINFFAPSLQSAAKNSFLMAYRLDNKVLDYIDSKKTSKNKDVAENE